MQPNLSKEEQEIEIYLSYQEYLAQGDEYFAKGTLAQLKKAKYAYVDALRIVDREQDLLKQVTVMKKIGNVYLEYGKQNSKEKNFIKAIALYNAARVRCDNSNEEQELIICIKEAERCFLEKALQKSLSKDSPLISSFLSDKTHTAFLANLRNYCQYKLANLDQSCNPSLEKDNPKREKLYRKRAKKIQNLYTHISKEMKFFVSWLVEECIEVLGKPPCDYAIISFGSMAREGMTPYSDFEFAILIKPTKQYKQYYRMNAHLPQAELSILSDILLGQYKTYFRRLSYLLHIKVLNLGETILPAIAIKALNNYDTEDKSQNWFRDYITPRGFSFDGAMPWASKNGIGRSMTKAKPWKIDLIDTPDLLAGYQTISSDFKEGYNLATVLATAVFIKGKKSLFKDYTRKVTSILQQSPRDYSLPISFMLQSLLPDLGPFSPPTLETLSQIRAYTTLLKDFLSYNLRLDQLLKEESFYEVKKEFYRFIDTTIEGLAFYYNIREPSNFKRIDSLPKKAGFDKTAKQHLKVALTIAMEWRLKTYLANYGQREKLQILNSDFIANSAGIGSLPYTAITLKEIDKREEGPIFRFYATAIPLQKILLQLLISGNKKAKFHLYDMELYTKALIHTRLFQYEQTQAYVKTILTQNPNHSEALVLLAHSLSMQGKFEESKTIYEKALQYPILTKDAAIHTRLGETYGALTQPIEKLLHLEEALDTTYKQRLVLDASFILSLKEFIDTFKKLGPDNLENFNQIYQETQSNNIKVNYFPIIESYISIIEDFCSLGHFKEANNTFHKVFNIVYPFLQSNDQVISDFIKDTLIKLSKQYHNIREHLPNDPHPSCSASLKPIPKFPTEKQGKEEEINNTASVTQIEQKDNKKYSEEEELEAAIKLSLTSSPPTQSLNHPSLKPQSLQQRKLGEKILEAYQASIALPDSLQPKAPFAFEFITVTSGMETELTSILEKHFSIKDAMLQKTPGKWTITLPSKESINKMHTALLKEQEKSKLFFNH